MCRDFFPQKNGDGEEEEVQNIITYVFTAYLWRDFKRKLLPRKRNNMTEVPDLKGRLCLFWIFYQMQMLNNS